MNFITLENIAKISSGFNPSQSKESEILPKNHHYSTLSLKNFNQSVCLSKDYISESLARSALINEKFIIRPNDILVKLIAPIWAIFIQATPPNLIYTHSVAKISPTSTDFLPEFLAFYFNSLAVKRQLMANTLQSTTVALIKISDLSKLQIPLIALSEQTKIVQILRLAQRKNEILHSLIAQNQSFSKAILDKFTPKTNTNFTQRTAQ